MGFSEGIVLTQAEARVLGALVEKEVTTPEYYPLSLNALVNACNQRSNREPVMQLSEDEAREAIRGLEEKRLAGTARGAEGRVAKYEHWLGEAFNLTRAETALLCVLLLRGPQTPGELRGRTERMHVFGDISDVMAGLDKLRMREPALVSVLARQPGTKESRYAHLLSGAVEGWTRTEATSAIAGETCQAERMAQLEADVAELRQEVSALRDKLNALLG